MPIIEASWQLLSVLFGLMLLLTIIMGMLSQNFYTQDVVVKKFSIMDLEIPATQTELVNLIKGLYTLPQPGSGKAIKSLRANLFIDFLFMPCAYSSIFILCMLVANKMQSFGVDIFIVLAWLQIVPFTCDIIENVYLLQKIKPEPFPSSKKTHRLYLFMQFLKWGISLIAAISAIAAVCYFWLSRNYGPQSFYYGVIIIAELIVFVVIGKILFKKSKIEVPV